MLLKEFMTRLTTKIIGKTIDASLQFVPSRYKNSLQEKTLKHPLQVGTKINSWTYKELLSAESGITHRYFYCPGPKKDAPVFLFLHGLIFDSRNFINQEKLSDTWQLIAYDFPETSEAYRGDMNDFRYLIDDFLDCLKIDTLYLCGVSFGGGVALRYSAAHLRRIKALVLVSSFVMNSSNYDRIKSRGMAKTLLKHPDYKIHWLIHTILKFSFSGRKNPLSPLKHLIRVKQIDWYRQVVKSITTCEGPEDAGQIKCPVLALCGTNDTLVTVKQASSISKFIPHSQFTVIPNGNHAMMYLQGEELSEIIRNFCNSNP